MPVPADGTHPSEPPDHDQPRAAAPAYHLLLLPQEVRLLRTALELLVTDAGGGSVRALARAVLARVPGTDGAGPEASAGASRDDDVDAAASIPLEAGEMKIVHTAVHLLLDDLQREQADEMQILHQILDKLPDEHAIRAIELE
jgi:hypothetical protein